LGGFLHFEAVSRRVAIGPSPCGVEQDPYFRSSGAAFPGISFQESMVLASAALRRGDDFGMVPPI
jgi:hypothetical protein